MIEDEQKHQQREEGDGEVEGAQVKNNYGGISIEET
jgi:hypothetical protein